MENDLDQYIDELEALRFELREFSKKYPHVASKLGANINGGMSSDVQYIVEAIAYVAFKIRNEIDNAPKGLAYLIIKSFAPYLVRKRSSSGMMKIKFSPDKKLSKIPRSDSGSRLKYTGKQGELYFSYAGYNKIIPYDVLKRGEGTEFQKIAKDNSSRGGEVEIYLKYCGTDKLESIGEFDIRFYLVGSRLKAFNSLEKIVRGFKSCTVYSETGVKLCRLGEDCLVLEIDQKLSKIKDYNWMSWGEELGGILANSDELNCFYIKGVKPGLIYKDLILSMNISELTSEEVDYIESSLVVNAFMVKNEYRQKNIMVPLKNNLTEIDIPRQSDAESLWDVIKVNSVSILDGADEKVLPNADDILGDGGEFGGQLAWQEFIRERPLSRFAYAANGIRLVNYKSFAGNAHRQYLKIDCTVTNCSAPEYLESEVVLYDEVSGISGEIIGNFSSYNPGILPGNIGIYQIDSLLKINTNRSNLDLGQKINDILNLYSFKGNELLSLFKKCFVGIGKKYEAKSDVEMPYGTYRLVETYKVKLRGGAEWRGVSFMYSRLVKVAIGLVHDNELPFCVEFSYDNGSGDGEPN